MSGGYKLSAQAAAMEQKYRAQGSANKAERKALWNPESGRASFQNGDNFRTNQVTVADFYDRVSVANPIGLSATFACVNLIAGTIASLSPVIFRPDDNGTRIEDRSHPLYYLLKMDPNFDQTGYEFWEFCAASIELHGNAYARLDRNNGRIVALTPVRPDLVRVKRESSGGLIYRWSEAGEDFQLPQESMLHIRGFGGSALGGASTLSVCRSTFSAALATDNTARALFENQASPSGVLSMPTPLTQEQRTNLEGILVEKFIGARNSGRPMLLDNGLKWESLSIDPVDAEMLASRKFSGEEICRIFGVPPAMVGYGDKASNWGTGKEVDVLGFIKFALRKRLRRIEQALMKQLLSVTERRAGTTIEFNLEGLLRGDSAGRASFYNTMVRLGLMTRNEARALENLPPIPGGDVAMVQMQDVPLTDAVQGE